MLIGQATLNIEALLTQPGREVEQVLDLVGADGVTTGVIKILMLAIPEASVAPTGGSNEYDKPGLILTRNCHNLTRILTQMYLQMSCRRWRLSFSVRLQVVSTTKNR